MKMVSIEDACVVVTDGTHYTPPDAGKGVPFLTVKDMSTQGLDFTSCSYITLDEYIKADLGNSSPKVGDVLFSKDGTVGKVHVVFDNQEFAVLSSIAILRPRLEVLDSQYFGHILRSPFTLDQAIRRKTGSAIRRIILKDLKQVQIPLPPLEEQRRIAAILDKADAVRRKRQSAIALTEELLRSAFLEMFGDPVTNSKGWEVKRLETTFARNPQIGTTKPAHSDGQHLVVRVGEVGGRNVMLNECGRVTLEGKDLERFLCEPSDLLLARAIGSESHLGKASILQHTAHIVVFDSHVMRLRFLPKILSPVFFLQWLKTEGGRTRFLREAGRTAVQFNVNAKQISKVEIPLPPIKLQEQFVRFYTRTLKCIENYGSGHEATDKLFNSLLQRAFCGEL